MDWLILFVATDFNSEVNATLPSCYKINFAMLYFLYPFVQSIYLLNYIITSLLATLSAEIKFVWR